MPRVVTYEEPAVQAEFAKLVGTTEKANTRAPAPRERRKLTKQAAKQAAAEPTDAAAAAAAGAKVSDKDDYLSKIAKYVPAETITATTLMLAAFTPHGSTVWLYLVAGSVANVLYLLSVALSADPKRVRPRWFFYVLSVATFWLWALATIDGVRDWAGLTGANAATKQTAILAGTAFIVPAIDTLLTSLTGRSR